MARKLVWGRPGPKIIGPPSRQRSWLAELVDFGPVHGAIEAGYEPQIEPAAVVHYRLHWRPGRVLGRGFVDGQAGPALYELGCCVGRTDASVRHGVRYL